MADLPDLTPYDAPSEQQLERSWKEAGRHPRGREGAPPSTRAAGTEPGAEDCRTSNNTIGTKFIWDTEMTNCPCSNPPTSPVKGSFPEPPRHIPTNLKIKVRMKYYAFVGLLKTLVVTGSNVTPTI